MSSTESLDTGSWSPVPDPKTSPLRFTSIQQSMYDVHCIVIANGL